MTNHAPTSLNSSNKVVVVSTRMVEFISPFRALLTAMTPTVAVVGLAVFQAVSGYEGIGLIMVMCALLVLASTSWLNTNVLRLRGQTRTITGISKENPTDIDLINGATQLVVAISMAALMISVASRIINAFMQRVILTSEISPEIKQIWIMTGIVVISAILLLRYTLFFIRDSNISRKRLHIQTGILFIVLALIIPALVRIGVANIRSDYQWMQLIFVYPEELSNNMWYENFFQVFGGIGLLAFVAGNAGDIASQYRHLRAPKRTNSKKFTFGITLFLMILAVSIAIIARFEPFGQLIASHFADPLTPSFGTLWEYNGLLYSALTVLAILTALVFALVGYKSAVKRAHLLLNEWMENGLLPGFLRTQHPRFGTFSRLFVLCAIIQLIIIIVAQPLYELMGLVSFSVLVFFLLQFIRIWPLFRQKYGTDRIGDQPPKSHNDKRHLIIPIFIMFFIGILALSLAVVQARAVAGSFVLIGAFYLTANYNRRNTKQEEPDRNADQLQFELSVLDTDLTERIRSSELRPILVAARHPAGLFHLKKVLEENIQNGREIVVMTVRVAPDRADNAGQSNFGRHERTLFQEVMRIAENYGRKITPIVVTGTGSFEAIIHTSLQLNAEAIVLGLSGKVAQEEQIREFSRIWRANTTQGTLPITLRIITPKQDNSRLLDVDSNQANKRHA